MPGTWVLESVMGCLAYKVNVLKFGTLYSIYFWLKFCYLCNCFFKYSQMTNSADPDQTAYDILSESLVFEI